MPDALPDEEPAFEHARAGARAGCPWAGAGWWRGAEAGLVVKVLAAGQQRDAPADVGAVHRPAAAVEDEGGPDGDQYPVAVLQGFPGCLAPAHPAGEFLFLQVLILQVLEVAVDEVGVRVPARPPSATCTSTTPRARQRVCTSLEKCTRSPPSSLSVPRMSAACSGV